MPLNRYRDGGATTIEVTLLTPVLVLFIVALVQFALWYHARHIVLAAAQEGARVARVESGTATAGERRAVEYLTLLGPRLVTTPRASATRTRTEVRVTVTGEAVRVLPWLHLRLSATAVSPTETFMP